MSTLHIRWQSVEWEQISGLILAIFAFSKGSRVPIGSERVDWRKPGKSSSQFLLPLSDRL